MNTSDYLLADVQLRSRLYAISLHHLIDVQSRFSPVPLNTILACRYPYTAGFFGIAIRVLHTFFLPSPLIAWLGSLLSLSGSTCRCGSIHFMLQPAKLSSLILKPYNASKHRFLCILVADYGTALPLSRQDFHLQASRSLAGRDYQRD